MPEEYREEFLKKFIKNPSLESEKRGFESILSQPIIWRVFEATEKGFVSIDVDNLPVCKYRKNNRVHESICRNNIRKLAWLTIKSKKPKTFRCPGNRCSVIIPLMQGDKLFGLIMICNLREPISEKLLSLFISFTQTIMNDVTKELELSKLY